MRIVLVVFILLVSACRPIGNADEVLALLKKCESTYGESCSMAPVPDSEEKDMRDLYQKWKDER